MKEQFCDLETREMLKELLFDEHCLGVYFTKDGDVRIINSNEYGDAPLWQQVKQWLWEKHKIHIEIRQSDVSYHQFYFGLSENNNKFFFKISKTNFDSPVIGETEGIKAAVKHLHEQL